MKRALFTSIMIMALINSFGQSGRLIVTCVKFKCLRESWDDILNTDGKGDEIRIRFHSAVYNKQNMQTKAFDSETADYGDATGNFKNRINAGSCVDAFGKSMGGIRMGDEVFVNQVVTNIQLQDGDSYLLSPIAWELDPNADQIAPLFNTVTFIPAVFSEFTGNNILRNGSLGGANLSNTLFLGPQLGINKISFAGGNQGLVGKAGTRPIGMETLGHLTPKFIVLNAAKCKDIIGNDFGYGMNQIAIEYNEPELNNNRDHAIYKMIFKIEFFADPNSSAAPATITQPATPPTAAATPSTGKPVAIISQPTTLPRLQPIKPSISGDWKGTYGFFQNTGPNPFYLRFGANGLVEMFDQAGKRIGNGDYTLNNTVFSANLNYMSGQKWTLLGNQNGNKIEGTWKAGGQLQSNGKFIVMQ